MSTIKPRTATVTIYQGDYLDRIRRVEAEAEAARQAESGLPRMMDETSLYEEKRAEHQTLIAEAEADAIRVKVGALGRRKWRDLTLAHPPRTTPDVTEDIARSDAAVGVNEDTFKDELVVKSIIEPAFTSRAAADEFMDDLADVDFDQIYYTAFALNRAVGADPKSLPALPPMQQSDAT